MKLINLPNTITCMNLLCGCMAIYFVFQGALGCACLLIIAGAVFDFFDGMTARLLKISGPIGKELDSLADVVTFGIAPSALCYSLFGTFYEADSILPLFAFIMAAFSALRLAKFNCDERQTSSFIGLPTPANALLWIGLCHINLIPEVHAWGAIPYWVLLLACCELLICELPMFSLKVKFDHLAFRDNALRYSFVIACVAIGIAFALIGYFAASPAAIILLYVILSIIDNQRNKK